MLKMEFVVALDSPIGGHISRSVLKLTCALYTDLLNSTSNEIESGQK